MLRIIRPSVPLNPFCGLIFMLYNENICRLGLIDARTIFVLKTDRVEWLVPPSIHIWFGKPSLKYWKIRPRKRAERHQSVRAPLTLHLQVGVP